MKADTLSQVQADRAAKRPVVLATNLASGAEHLIYPGEPNDAGDPLYEPAREAMRSDKSRTVETDEGAVFLHIFNPPLRMIVVGAVHIGQPLARMGVLAGCQGSSWM